MVNNININIALEEDGRISRVNLNMALAEMIAYRATCKRGKVGCIITSEGRVIATGYNGSVVKQHCDLLHCDLTQTCVHAVHAEANAIAFAAKLGIQLKGCYLYCTHGPCINCAKLIIQAGIAKIFYKHEYKDNFGLMLLEQMGVKIQRVG